MSSAEAIGRERRIGYSMALKLDQMRCSRWDVGCAQVRRQEMFEMGFLRSDLLATHSP
jgi:hypothetical protein